MIYCSSLWLSVMTLDHLRNWFLSEKIGLLSLRFWIEEIGVLRRIILNLILLLQRLSMSILRLLMMLIRLVIRSSIVELLLLLV